MRSSRISVIKSWVEHIDLELDVVRRRGIDRERFLEMRAEQVAGGAGRFCPRLEIMHHARNLTDAAELAAKFFAQKKPGGETEFSSRVEVNLMEERLLSPLFCGLIRFNVSFCRMLFS